MTTKTRCPTCHGFGIVMGRDFESKPCHNPKCVNGWVEDAQPGAIEAVCEPLDYELMVRLAGDLSGAEL